MDVIKVINLVIEDHYQVNLLFHFILFLFLFEFIIHPGKSFMLEYFKS